VSVANELVALQDLAGRINEAHRQVELHAAAALEKAREAGDLLLDAKGKVGHGRWLPWLAENVCCSERTAQIYMRVAKHWRWIDRHPRREQLTLREASLVRPQDVLAVAEADPRPVAELPPDQPARD
jgi:hypothetical protein